MDATSTVLDASIRSRFHNAVHWGSHHPEEVQTIPLHSKKVTVWVAMGHGVGMEWALSAPSFSKTTEERQSARTLRLGGAGTILATAEAETRNPSPWRMASTGRGAASHRQTVAGMTGEALS